MPKSRARKRKKEQKKQIAQPISLKLSWYARIFQIGELNLLLNSAIFMLIGMYAMGRTDKLSPQTKITVDMIQLSIIVVMIINSGVIMWAEKRRRRLRWLEQRIIFGYVCGVALFWVTSYMSLRISKYPQEVEQLIAVKFPGIGRGVASTISRTATFLTSGVMSLVTNVVLNVFSSYIFLKLTQKKAKT